jgi:hypothetical protein
LFRHNLAVLDRMLVVDHGSMDGTSQILASLVREGLAVDAVRDDARGYPLQATIVALTRRAFADHAADFVVPLDSDEFLKVRSRAHLESALAELPPSHHARMEWLTYVPPFGAGASTLTALRTARRVAAERHGLTKVIVARSFASQPAATIELGAHNVHAPVPSTLAPHVMFAPDCRGERSRADPLGAPARSQDGDPLAGQAQFAADGALDNRSSGRNRSSTCAADAR